MLPVLFSSQKTGSSPWNIPYNWWQITVPFSEVNETKQPVCTCWSDRPTCCETGNEASFSWPAYSQRVYDVSWSGVKHCSNSHFGLLPCRLVGIVPDTAERWMCKCRRDCLALTKENESSLGSTCPQACIWFVLSARLKDAPCKTWEPIA